jgi:hypothetical protein
VRRPPGRAFPLCLFVYSFSILHHTRAHSSTPSSLARLLVSISLSESRRPCPALPRRSGATWRHPSQIAKNDLPSFRCGRCRLRLGFRISSSWPASSISELQVLYCNMHCDLQVTVTIEFCLAIAFLPHLMLVHRFNSEAIPSSPYACTWV